MIELLENSLSLSLNFLFLLSLVGADLDTVRYLSQPRMMLPYRWVSSR